MEMTIYASAGLGLCLIAFLPLVLLHNFLLTISQQPCRQNRHMCQLCNITGPCAWPAIIQFFYTNYFFLWLILTQHDSKIKFLSQFHYV